MKIKQILYISIAISAVILTFGILIYRNFNSIENQTKRALRSDITEWYYRFESLTHDQPDVLKSEADKNKIIELRKVINNLNEKWEFQSENYTLQEIGYSAVLVDSDYLFENRDTREQRFFSTRYYYELDEVMPVPLKEEVYSIDGQDHKMIKTSKLWEGDFDSYCAKPKEIESSDEIEL